MMNDADIYRKLLRIRRTEEKIVEIYATDVVKSPVHLSIGQEFISVGVCEALRASDVVFGTYRSHALYLAKGGALNAMWAELFGKRDGCARGKGGSMHLSAPDAGMMGTSAIVATGIPNAVGFALAEKMRGSDKVVAVFFGDGAVDEGVFHESMNFAALKKLPVLFVCENNFFAIYSRIDERMPEANLLERAAAYRVPGIRIEDGRTESVRSATAAAADRIRNGEGPQFLECCAYRWRDHVGPDDDSSLGYRPTAEMRTWKAKDDLAAIRERLPAAAREAVERQVEDELLAALAFAEGSAFLAIEEVYSHVLA